jgi:homoserine/homoserine lactone efflux protein
MPLRWETWALYLVTETTLCLTPGPAVLLVLSQGLSRGSLASIWSGLGILAGNTFYFILSATGLGMVVAASHDLFSAVRWIGAAYLVWLGVRTFRGHASVSAVRAAGDAGWMFVNGFILQAANPKALLFFTALLPQFIDPAGNVPAQVVVLGVTSVVVESCVLAAYGALAGQATALAARPRFAMPTNRIAGSLLITAGVGTAAIRRR